LGAELVPAEPNLQTEVMSKHLDLTERIELEAGLRAGDSQGVGF